MNSDDDDDHPLLKDPVYPELKQGTRFGAVGQIKRAVEKKIEASEEESTGASSVEPAEKKRREEEKADLERKKKLAHEAVAKAAERQATASNPQMMQQVALQPSAQVHQATSMLQPTGIIHQPTTMLQQPTSVIPQATGIIQQHSAMMQGASGMMQQHTGIIQPGGPMMQQIAPVTPQAVAYNQRQQNMQMFQNSSAAMFGAL